MQITIIYATTEGQTRRIARHIQQRIAGAGHAVELLPAEAALETEPALDGAGAAILLGSVHGGRYQPDLVTLAAREAGALDAIPDLFISVSLAAAGDDPEDWEGLADCVERFKDETGWTPARVEHVAGAFRFTEYNWFTTWAMRYIQAQKDPTARRGKDAEYTDWAAVDAMVDDWLSGL